jgi:hypothetical protein
LVGSKWRCVCHFEMRSATTIEKPVECFFCSIIEISHAPFGRFEMTWCWSFRNEELCDDWEICLNFICSIIEISHIPFGQFEMTWCEPWKRRGRCFKTWVKAQYHFDYL